jgi:hypothetical protein
MPFTCIAPFYTATICDFLLSFLSYLTFFFCASMGICQSTEDARESKRSCQIDKQLEKERIKQEYKILLLGYTSKHILLHKSIQLNS